MFLQSKGLSRVFSNTTVLNHQFFSTQPSLYSNSQEYMPPGKIMCVLSHFSCDHCCVTLWTSAYQAPLSVGFQRQEYQSGLPCPPPGDLPDPGIKLHLLHCRQILFPLSHQGSPLFTHQKQLLLCYALEMEDLISLTLLLGGLIETSFWLKKRTLLSMVVHFQARCNHPGIPLLTKLLVNA